MTGHNCPNCGAFVPCDKRQSGTGRKHDVNWKPSANHATVLRALTANPRSTVKQLQAYLNHKVDISSNLNDIDLEWRHQGKSIYWTQLAVQTPISDLLGIGLIRSMQATKGRELIYWRPDA